ncbi:AAA family ATPase [[Pseudomonas] boreopolis]|uniref:AAA family ATPase n=1 Tax=Xanthomonas boreopolis TaxID=86183 RepID=UPI003D4FB6EA
MTNPQMRERPAGTGRTQDSEAGGFGIQPSAGAGAMQVAYSRGSRATDNTPEQRTADTFAQFLDAIAGDRGTGKGQQYICAPVGIAPDDELHRGRESFARAIGQPHRCKECVLPVDWLGLDADDGKDGCADLTPESFAALVGIVGKYSGIVYTTASHAPDKPRCRIVLELDQAAPRAERIRASQAIRARIDADMEAAGYGKVPWDEACDRPEQMLYLPVTKSDVYRLEGSALCLAELLAEVPPEATQEPQEAPQGPPVSEPTAYALRALESAARAVRNAPPGDRNKIVNAEAHGLGGFVPTGQLSRAVIEATLLAETAAWNPPDVTPDKTRATIQAGIASGMAKPRSDGMPPRPVDASGVMAKVKGETPPGELRLVPLAGFMAKPVPEHPHVMESYYPRRVVTLLGGHGGVGKTTLALTHAAHIAAGRPWGPFDVVQGRVVFLSFEDEGADIMRSLQDVVNVCALPPGEIERNFVLFDGTDGESELAVESSEGGATRLEFTDMMRKAEEAAAGADIVFIDNASDTFGGNENVRRQVKAFIRALARRIARGNNAAVVLLAHIDKQAAKGNAHGNSYSGSTAWHNGARSRLALLESEDGIELVHEKARWGRKADPIALQRVQGGILKPVAAEQAAAAKANAQAVMVRADAKDVLAVIRAAVDADLTIPVARTGQRTTWHALCEMPEMPEALRTKREGKPRVEAAITALEREGAIVREEYRNPSRRVAMRWTLAQEQAAEAA